MKKIRNIDPFNDWMNDFELPQTNEWRKKITLSHTISTNEWSWGFKEQKLCLNVSIVKKFL